MRPLLAKGWASAEMSSVCCISITKRYRRHRNQSDQQRCWVKRLGNTLALSAGKGLGQRRNEQRLLHLDHEAAPDVPEHP